MALEYKGVNLAGLEFGNGNRIWYDYALPGKEHYDYWANDVGSNIIRLPFMWERLQPKLGGALDAEYLSYLKSSVEWAKQNDMTIALDLHNYARHNGSVVNGSQLADVWKKLHDVFGNDPDVWFNLMNEPHSVSAESWANTTQAVVNNLRAAGVENKLLLSGTAWSGAHSWVSSGNAAAYKNFSDPLDNYAFDVHQYLDRDSSGFSGEAVKGAGSTRLVAVTQWAEENGHQLFLGETGLANNQDSHNEMSAMIKYMEDHGDAWLGFTLWGAGPWWGQDYVFYINPSNLGGNEIHANSISKILQLLVPDDIPDLPGDPGPDPDPDPGPGDPDGDFVNLTQRADTIDGTDGDDTVAAWMGQIGPEDTVALGGGHDTLFIHNTGLTMDTATLSKFSGIDHIDITQSKGKASVYLTEEFIAQSDHGKVTISHGNAGYGNIIMVTDTPQLYRIEQGDNEITVTYQGQHDPGDPGGRTYSKLTKGADVVNGTSGNDTVEAWLSQIGPEDTVALDDGYDTLLINNVGLTLDTSILPKFSGIDHIDVSQADGKANILLTREFIAQSDHGEVTISFGDSGPGRLDISGLGKGSYAIEWMDDSVTVALFEPALALSGEAGTAGLYAISSGDVLDESQDLTALLEANGLAGAGPGAGGMADGGADAALSAASLLRMDSIDDLAHAADLSALAL